ncbi:MAG TPA: hypothetical protein VF517_18645 [Thermoleophilaceae bacterium]|jgi:hypothetical protein
MATASREERLEERIRDLEDELHRRSSGREGRGRRQSSGRWGEYEDTREDFADFTDRKVDEISRLVTGSFRAGLEALRVAAESTDYFVDDVLERNLPNADEDSTDVARRLPRDLGRGFSRSLERGLDIPGRASERFNRTYTYEEGGQPWHSRRGRRGGRGRRGRGRRDEYTRRRAPSGEDYERWSQRELYDEAAERGIDWSDLTREELVEELRKDERGYEDWPTPELYRRARDLEIRDRADMDRDELIDAIRRREERANPARSPLERRRGGSGDGESTEEDYDKWSRSELEERAAACGIENASEKSREELVEAVKRHEPPPEDQSRTELYQRARELDIEGRSQMSREELVEAIKSHEKS